MTIKMQTLKKKRTVVSLDFNCESESELCRGKELLFQNYAVTESVKSTIHANGRDGLILMQCL